MPIYEYECSACEQVFEVQQRMTEDPVKECPDCGKAVKKLVSASSFQLKGGGWYADGYSGRSNSDKKDKDGKAKESTAPPCKKAGTCGANCPAAA